VPIAQICPTSESSCPAYACGKAYLYAVLGKKSCRKPWLSDMQAPSQGREGRVDAIDASDGVTSVSRCDMIAEQRVFQRERERECVWHVDVMFIVCES